MPLRGIVELCFRRVGDGFWGVFAVGSFERKS